jgi:putative membrane protein insertion efficiency factor
MMARLLTLLVRVYQLTLRGVIGAHCRFEPSCSHYAIEALNRHGAARGTMLAAWRVLRCNPWHQGGWDPVPHPVQAGRQGSRHESGGSACRCHHEPRVS